MHLQYGHSDYTGRHGEEAADIFATMIVSNPNIRFPGETDEDVQKRIGQEMIEKMKKMGGYY